MKNQIIKISLFLFILTLMNSSSAYAKKLIISADEFFSPSGQTFDQQAYFLTHTNSSSITLQASVDIPKKKKIKKIKMYYYDTSDASIHCRIKYFDTDTLSDGQIAAGIISSNSTNDPEKVKSSLSFKITKKKYVFIELILEGKISGQEALKFYRVEITYK